MVCEIYIRSESELDEKLYYDEEDFLVGKEMNRAMVIASDDGEIVDFS